MPNNSVEAPMMPTHIESQAAQAVERGQGSPTPMQQMPAFQQPVTTVADPMTTGASSGSSPAIADDTDLIEKEWVIKAKEIVARTKHDPYQQNKEVEQVKADYLKKRFNKDVKVAEG